MVSTSLLLLTLAASAEQPPRAMVLVDATGDAAIDGRITSEVSAAASRAGFVVLSGTETAAAFQSAGGYSAGRVSTDPVVLEQARTAGRAAVLVRVSRASGGATWVGAEIKVVSYRGQTATAAVAPHDQAPQKIAGAVAPLLPPPPPATATPPVPVPAPVPGPPPAGTSGTPLPGPPLQGAPSAESGSVDPNRRQADAQFQRDCAKDPSQEICKQQGGVSMGAGGLSAGFSQEKVTRVKTPPSYSIDFAIDGSFTYGKLTYEMPAIAAGAGSSTIESEFFGGGLSLGVKILTGGKFPGPEGGSWLGAFIDPSFSVSGAGGQMTIPAMSVGGYTIPESKMGYGMLMLNGGVAVGLQWLTFGSMNPETLQQGGFGLNAGYRIGAVGSQVYFEGGSGDFTTSFSHGPVVGLSFPFYNAGTASLSRFYLQGMILPTGDMLLVTIAAGFAF